MKRFLPLVLLSLLILSISCRKEDDIASSGISLAFSADTVFLDTVFNTIGSSTYVLKVLNPQNKTVIVDNIRLERGNSSFYRLNVNGIATKNISSVEILPNDSMYVFVELTVDTTFLQGLPEFVYSDNIVFSNKGTVQNVNLQAQARQAIFHFPNRFIPIGEPPNQISIPFSVINCNETWDNSIPHVIYGYAVVDSGCTLNITAGANIHFHQNAGLWVFNGGSLKVGENSTSQLDSITFQGDRLEPFYENIPGQWGGILGGIFIDSESENNIINHAVIKNAVTAIRLNQVTSGTPNLTINNTYVLNSSRVAIYGGSGNMRGNNLVVANSGLYLFFGLGGDYEFRHCTFANYWSQSTPSRQDPAIGLANFFEFTEEDGSIRREQSPLTNAYFGNCIVTGNNGQELGIFEDNTSVMQFKFQNVLLKVDTDPDERGFNINDQNRFDWFPNAPLINLDPLFVDVNNNDYRLDTIASPVIDQGNLIDGSTIETQTDIRGVLRSTPDLGAIEFQ